MRRIRLFLLACTVALSSIVWSAGPVAAAADNEVYYLALGDSLAAGYQPRGAQEWVIPISSTPSSGPKSRLPIHEPGLLGGDNQFR